MPLVAVSAGVSAVSRSERPCWFVGATYGGADDQTERFLADGIWENGYEDRLLDQVRSMQPGDRIAIKSSYTRKTKLPFDARGQAVSTMSIKAFGTIVENFGDGRRVRVIWQRIDPPREWYFYTQRSTVWQVKPEDWMTEGLIAFTFEGEPQDIDRFRNSPFWRERYGDPSSDADLFGWTTFYEALASGLLRYQHDRAGLVKQLETMSQDIDVLGYLQDHYADGGSGFVRDICPFTVIGTFNRGVHDSKRIALATALAQFLEVEVAPPTSFDGIPILNNMNSWFFRFENLRGGHDIDLLWAAFAAALKLADEPNEVNRDAFVSSYDVATSLPGAGMRLSTGLYWARPWSFATLDGPSRLYLERKLQVMPKLAAGSNRIGAAEYASMLETLETRFKDELYPVHSFPQLSYEAWRYKDPVPPVHPDPPLGPVTLPPGGGPDGTDPVPSQPYSIQDILKDGCFLEAAELEQMLDRLRQKKNLILQGPPGTGKTWLARRLAYALTGQKDDRHVRAVQFHPNLSYEDFVRGWRPAGTDGKLDLVDGTFMEMISAARNEPDSRFVLVIEEINRGNPAQIFGETLTLLETDKRTPSESLELCYRREEAERIYIPGNLYVIGTMNIADRSLALVDLALRRRFAFIDLTPRLGPAWCGWVISQCHLDPARVDDIERRFSALNDEIAGDPNLGLQFRLGHSYVTPPAGRRIEDTQNWFRQVVHTEIGPLLSEYWFDTPARARAAVERLLAGL